MSYRSGAILGTEQFLYDDPWQMDLIAKSDQCIICKYTYEQYLALQKSNKPTAAKLFCRIYR